MKIVDLKIENFRALDEVELTSLQGMVVIAGPNGCGKSCILDAVRLFKSVYGGYQQNEWQQWFGEFQINVQNPRQTLTLLKTPSRPLIIEAYIELANDEIAFIKQDLDRLLTSFAWNRVVPNAYGYSRAGASIAADLRSYSPQVSGLVERLRPDIAHLLASPRLHGSLAINPDGNINIYPNPLLEIVFSSYEPTRLGVVDYHGAHRNYQREALGGINLNLDQEEEKFKTSSLYNYANKYTNIKSEMAAEFIKEMLGQRSGGSSGIQNPTSRSLSETMKYLFSVFFPGKEFLGPQSTPEGNMEFPVRLSDGSKHDINDLSSGEKEILFGYLRVRSSAPKHSIVLIDEPELHLNPALVRGLPRFYYEHVGQELGNQIWLVTHSDAFLREAMGQSEVQVYHLQHADAEKSSGNQIHEIRLDEESESLIVEMVGNLASYRPGAKVVFLEGENSEFDAQMVSRLFPGIGNELNLVSVGNRSRVESLHRVIDRSVQAGNIPVKIYSIVDKDAGGQVRPTREFGRHYSWDVYHIENYLLSPKYIRESLVQISLDPSNVPSEEEIEASLKKIAESQIDKLVAQKVRADVGTELMKAINLGRGNPESGDIGQSLHKSVKDSAEKIGDLLSSDLKTVNLDKRVDQERTALGVSLKSDDWRKTFRGRDILSAFAGEHAKNMRYDQFRNLVISQMAHAGYQPEGMKSVLDSILESDG